MFIIFSGPSGCGKNTIMSELKKLRPNLRYLEHSSATTRPERASDSEDKGYVFLSRDEFEKAIKAGKLYEYEEVHGNYYGTLLEKLEMASKSDLDYMKDVDVKGNISLKRFFEGRCKRVSIFIDVPDNILRKRLKRRGESDESIKKRLSRGEMERAYKNEYDLVVSNIDLLETVNRINDFLNNATK